MLPGGYLAAGALVIALAAGGWGAWQQRAAAAARAERDSLSVELSLHRAAAVEQARQAAANEAARLDAARRVLVLETDRAALRSQLERLADEADRDPRRDECGLSADGMRRLGAIGSAAGHATP